MGGSTAQDAAAQVVVFGTGSLALGLVAAKIDTDNLGIVIAGRESEVARSLKNHRRYISIAGNSPLEHVLSNVLLVNTSDKSKLKDVLVDPSTIAILTSVGPGQKAIAGLLRTLLSGHIRNEDREPILLIPCENRVHPDIQALNRFSGLRDILLCRTMVDRICQRPRISGVGPASHVSVQTESFSEWCLEFPQGGSGAGLYGVNGAVIARSLGATLVGNIVPVQIRKKTLMNSLQACIAALALGDHEDDIKRYLQTSVGRVNAEGLSRELAAVAAFSIGASMPEMEPLRKTYLARIRSHPDSAERILKTTRTDIDELRATIDERINSPLRILETEMQRPSVYIRKAVAAIRALLG